VPYAPPTRSPRCINQKKYLLRTTDCETQIYEFFYSSHVTFFRLGGKSGKSIHSYNVSNDSVEFKYGYVIKHNTWLAIFSSDIYMASFNCRDLSNDRVNLQSTVKFVVGMALEIKCHVLSLYGPSES